MSQRRLESRGVSDCATTGGHKGMHWSGSLGIFFLFSTGFIIQPFGLSGYTGYKFVYQRVVGKMQLYCMRNIKIKRTLTVESIGTATNFACDLVCGVQ